MTSNHHTPVTGATVVNAANTNAPYGELDQVATDLLAGLEAFTGLIVGGDTNAIVATYASSNQDSDIQIQGESYAGATENSGAQIGSFNTIGDVSAVDYWSAQSFQLSAGGRLSQFTFDLSANSGAPAGDLLWSIESDSAGDPDGVALENGTIANASVVASATNTVNITDGAILQGSTTYWLVMKSDQAEATNVRWQWTADLTGSYANGQGAFSSNSGSSWTKDGRDCEFEVTVDAIVKNDALAQGFKVTNANTVNSVKLWLKKVASPTGNLTVKIETDSAGDPSGTPIANGTSDTIDVTTLATGYGYITFTFATNPTIDPATQYHLVLDTTSSQSNTNWAEWGADESTPTYADGVMKRERSAVWTNQSADAVFEVYGTTVADSSSLLEIVSTTQGVLPPRMTTTQRNLLTPPNGTMIYNTTTNLINVYQGAAWVALAASGGGGEALVELVAPTAVVAQSSVSITVVGGYRDILLVFNAQSNAAGTPWEIRIQFNNDTGTNYRIAMDGWSGLESLVTANADSGIDLLAGDDSTEMWRYEVWLWNYLDTTDYRAVSIEGAIQSDDATPRGSAVGNAIWENAANAITSIQIKENNSSDWDGEYALYGLL